MFERKVFILAAGKGSRLDLPIPKVLAPLKERTILDYTLENVSKVTKEKVICIVGHQAQTVKEHFGCNIIYRDQKILNGNAGAILAGIDLIPMSGCIMAVQGDDSAFVTPQTYLDVFQTHEQSKAKITALLSLQFNPNTQHRYCNVKADNQIIACNQIS